MVDVVCTDTEVGFRKGRGTADATFLVRRLLESWRRSQPAGPAPPPEDDPLFLLFADLHKAFDALPRSELWFLLEAKLNVPASVVSMLRQIHSSAFAQASLRGGLGRAIPLSAGS